MGLQWLGLNAFTARLVAKKKKGALKILAIGKISFHRDFQFFHERVSVLSIQPAPCAIKLYVRKGVLKDFRKY